MRSLRKIIVGWMALCVCLASVTEPHANPSALAPESPWNKTGEKGSPPKQRRLNHDGAVIQLAVQTAQSDPATSSRLIEQLDRRGAIVAYPPDLKTYVALSGKSTFVVADANFGGEAAAGNLQFVQADRWIKDGGTRGKEIFTVDHHYEDASLRWRTATGLMIGALAAAQDDPARLERLRNAPFLTTPNLDPDSILAYYVLKHWGEPQVMENLELLKCATMHSDFTFLILEEWRNGPDTHFVDKIHALVRTVYGLEETLMHAQPGDPGPHSLTEAEPIIGAILGKIGGFKGFAREGTLAGTALDAFDDFHQINEAYRHEAEGTLQKMLREGRIVLDTHGIVTACFVEGEEVYNPTIIEFLQARPEFSKARLLISQKPRGEEGYNAYTLTLFPPKDISSAPNLQPLFPRLNTIEGIAQGWGGRASAGGSDYARGSLLSSDRVARAARSYLGFEDIRRTLAIDPDLRNKVDSQGLEVLSRLATVIDAEDIRGALENNEAMAIRRVVEQLRQMDFRKLLILLNGLEPEIPHRVFSQAFASSPGDVCAILHLFLENPDRTQWFISEIGGEGFAKAISESPAATQAALERLWNPTLELPSEQWDLEIWFLLSRQEQGALFSMDPRAYAAIVEATQRLDDYDHDRLARALPAASYHDSALANPAEFARFVDAVRDLRTESFLTMVQQQGRRNEDFTDIRRRFEKGADGFLLARAGMTITEMAHLARKRKEKELTPYLDYQRECMHPACAPRVWDRLAKDIAAQDRSLKLRPFDHVLQIRPVSEGPGDLLKLSVVFGPSELADLERQEISLESPEIGMVEFRIEGKRLVVDEIQSYVRLRGEKVPENFDDRYPSWPLFGLLGLWDYAQSHGLEEIWIPNDQFILTRLKKFPRNAQLAKELQHVTTHMPAALGYKPDAKGQGMKLRLNDTRGAQLYNAYASLLNPATFFQGLSALSTQPAKEPDWPRLKPAVLDMAARMAQIEQTGGSAHDLRKAMQAVARQHDIPPGFLSLNYTVEDGVGHRYHGISLAKADFVFTIDLQSHTVASPEFQRYPQLVPVGPGGPAESLFAGPLEWNEMLSHWPTHVVATFLPTVLRWGRQIGQGQSHQPVLQKELRRALAGFFERAKGHPYSARLPGLFSTLDDSMKSLSDSDKIELLLILNPALPWLLNHSEGIEQAKRLTTLAADMFRSNLRTASTVLRKLGDEKMSRGEFTESLQELLKAQEELRRTFPRKGQQWQALVAYAAGVLTEGQRDRETKAYVGAPTVARLILAAWEKFPPGTMPSVKDDLLAHLLLFDQREKFEDVLLTGALRPFEKESTVNPIALNRILEMVWQIEKDRENYPPDELVHSVNIAKSAQEVQGLLEGHLRKIKGENDLLLFDLMDKLRQSGPVKLAGESWHLSEDLDSLLNYDVAQIALHPTGKTRTADPALDLLRCDYSENYKAVPRGAIVVMDIAVVDVQGKKLLMLFERQQSPGFSRLFRHTPKGTEYRKSLESLGERLWEVAKAMPEIEGVLGLHGEEVLKRFAEAKGMTRQNVGDNYGIKRFLGRLGFRRWELPEGASLTFGRKMAFGTNSFEGPFWRVDFPRGADVTQAEELLRFGAGMAVMPEDPAPKPASAVESAL